MFPHRAFVMVDEATFLEFHKRWNDIDRLWPPGDGGEHYEAIRGLREHARAALRAEVRDCHKLNGRFLIPV